MFCEILALLFYRHPLANLLALLGLPFYIRQRNREATKRQNELLAGQLKETLQSLASAMQVGYSMENAWKEVHREMKGLYGEESQICIELRRMITRIEKNEPVEKVLRDFAQQTGQEDFRLFAEIVGYAKRGGGNFSQIMKTTIQQMGQKSDVDREIRTIISGKRLELRIMCLVPAAILAYLRLFSASYLNVLYQTPQGIVLMTACLMVYGGAWTLGKRMVEIEI